MYAPYEEQEIEELKSQVNVLTFKLQEFESAIQRVRELARAIGLGEAMLHSKVIETQILKALDGEQ